MRGFGALAAAALLIAGPVAAQEWRQVEDGAQEITAAMAIWPSGHALVARCQAEDFQTFLRLPEAVSAETPTLLRLEDQPSAMGLTLAHGEDQGQIVFAQEPARVARWLMNGGVLTVEAPGAATVSLALPPEDEPVGAALTACGRPLTSERDTLRRAGTVDWARIPSGRDLARLVPLEAAESGLSFHVLISCRVRADGRLEDCEVERESPPGHDMGHASIRAARHYMMSTPAADEVGSIVLIPIVWSMPGNQDGR